jgi:glycosyltransferase involved in cell wall biosynthesis
MKNPDLNRKEIKVSVIIPTYNIEKYINKCLNTLERQTLRPQEFEIIFIDGNSNDRTREFLEEYSRVHNNVKTIFCDENLGPGLARNLGLEKAKGEYIFFMDGDDYIDVTTLERLLMIAYNQDADIVTAGFSRVNEKEEILFQRNDPSEYLVNKLTWVQRSFSLLITPAVWNKLIRRDLFEENNIKFPDCLHEDVYVSNQLFFYAKNVVNYNDFLYFWVKRSDSITDTISEEHIDGFLNSILIQRDFVLNKGGYGLWRKLSDWSERGMMTVITLLINRISSYSLKNNKKFKLYKYLYSKIEEIDEFELKLSRAVNKNPTLITFFEIFSNEKDYKKAGKKFIEHFKKQQVKDHQNGSVKLETVVKLRAIKKRELWSRIKSLMKDLYNKKGGIIVKVKYFGYRLKKYYDRKFKIQKEKLPTPTLEAKPQLSDFEIVFFCDVDYHIRNTAPIIRALDKKGIKACILDYSKFTDSGRRQLREEEKSDYDDISMIQYKLELNDSFINSDFKVGVFFNDWGSLQNKTVRQLRNRGIKTISIVEGVSDFLKQNEGFTTKISPYRTTDYVSLPGKFDTRFFKDRPSQCFVSGLPKIRVLYRERVKFPKKPLAVINVNFSYEVLTFHRQLFLKTAVEGCKLAGIDYVLTQHPRDNADLSEYNLTDKNMYDTIRDGSIFISRFSGAIIEALAMGKPCVYHNPHNEKVLKFQEPMGAYSISDSAESLAKAIKYELDRSSKTRVREYSRKFMEYHANIGEKKEPAELITETIMELIKS